MEQEELEEEHSITGGTGGGTVELEEHGGIGDGTRRRTIVEQRRENSEIREHSERYFKGHI